MGGVGGIHFTPSITLDASFDTALSERRDDSLKVNFGMAF